MKKFIPIIAALYSAINCSQNSQLEGRWFWEDSTKTNIIVLDFREDNNIFRYAGPNNPVNRNNFKNGRYSLKKDSLLVITWDDKTTEECQISFSSKDSLFLTYGSNHGIFSNKKFKFGLPKGKDEEVRADEVPPEIKN